ncbi:hypothetical protein BN1723_007569 [Verticillium longisporum]|uniref:TGS domain-containing protein n=1 Tax=Verticillium longisporum TaxID=100787 RepID=A0A0G4NLZ0_VERLO|nr:hypothetical protein BN1723_007569 [Verticillium longisporum]
MVSTTSSVKDPASPRDPKHDETAERPKPELLTEKYHDRTKALKRDESRERLPGSGEPPSKRHRSSVTPPHSNKSDRDSAEGPAKRRRLDTEGKERRQRAADSADERSRSTQDGSAKPKTSLRETDDDGQRTTLKPNSDTDSHRKDHTRHSDSDKSSIHVKSEDVDVDMRDAPPPKAPKELDDEKRRRDADVEAKDARRREERQKEADKKRRDEREAREREAEKQRLVEEEEAKQRLEEEKRRKAREEKRRQVEEEKLRKAEEDKRIAEALAEEERLKREAEAKEAEEKKQREEAEAQRLRDEAERKRIEDEKRKRKEEEEEKQREEERVRQEKLAREAAEQARREKEEQARKALEDQERREREDRDRLEREAHEAALRQAREDEERKRRALELPPLLRWLEQCADPCTLDIASRFQHIQGVRYDTVRPEAVGTPEGRAQWLFNFQVALILGEKDLRLGKYPSWERLLVSDLAKPDLVKRAFWRLEADQYALTSHKYRDLGAELPNYYGEGQDASVVGSSVLGELRRDAQAKFLKMDMFLIKLSDLLSVIPTIAHLQDFRLSVEYREIPEDEAQELAFQTPRRYRQDPGSERFMGFAPRSTYYVNGQKVGEDLPGLAATSKVPFPDHERRVPRRNGLIETELEGFGIRINKSPPNITFKKKEKGGLNITNTVPLNNISHEEIKAVMNEYKINSADISIRCDATIDDVIDILEAKSRSYIPVVYVLNKIDAISIEELDLLYRIPNAVPISSEHGWNVDELMEAMWDKLNLVRVYTKPKGRMPDYSQPVVLRSNRCTVEDFCNAIHRTIVEQFKNAIVYGKSCKHQPQRVGLSHELADEDIVTIVKR